MARPGCDCAPGKRCDACRRIGRATVRMLTLQSCFYPGVELKQPTHPVEWADMQSRYHDARIALCLASGVPMSNIHPVTGHNLGTEHRYVVA